MYTATVYLSMMIATYLLLTTSLLLYIPTTSTSYDSYIPHTLPCPTYDTSYPFTTCVCCMCVYHSPTTYILSTSTVYLSMMIATYPLHMYDVPPTYDVPV